MPRLWMARKTTWLAVALAPIALTFAAGTAPAPAAAQDLRKVAEGLELTERFSGTLTLRGPNGGTREVRVVLRNWALLPSIEIERFPEPGLAVFQLRGGEVATVIGGRKRERQEGDFWRKPANQTMAIESDDDTAAFQSFSVR